MQFSRSAFFVISSAVFLFMSPAAHAQNSTNATIIKGPGVVTSFTTGVSVLGPEGGRDFNTSETAYFWYEKGIKRFEKGKLERAEVAFKASLNAQGSKNLDSRTLHYLAYINKQLGNEAQAEAYAQAYLSLTKK